MVEKVQGEGQEVDVEKLMENCNCNGVEENCQFVPFTLDGNTVFDGSGLARNNGKIAVVSNVWPPCKDPSLKHVKLNQKGGN